MNAITIIGLCLVSSSVVQGLGFFLYSVWYKRRYFSQQNNIDASFSAISGKPHNALMARGGGRTQQEIGTGLHKQQAPQKMPAAVNNFSTPNGASTKKAVATAAAQKQQAS